MQVEVNTDTESKNTTEITAEAPKEIQKEKKLEGWQIAKGDVFKTLGETSGGFDIIFADPPYDLPNLSQLPAMALKALKPEGIFVLEHRPGIVFPVTPVEIRKYGSSAIGIFIP